MASRKLILVSNRLPISLKKGRAGWDITPSSGGLVSALAPAKKDLDFMWVGWAGASVPENQQADVKARIVEEHNYHPVFLTTEQVESFYNNFCNRVLWPLCHYSPDRVDFEQKDWEEYQHVNQIFCDAIAPLCDDDTMVWVHDYHFFLLPQLLRQKKPNIHIGFFLHIPFPSSEIYRTLPVRKEILTGLLGSDLIGFQTHDYCRHFASACLRVLGLETTATQTTYFDRNVAFGSYPIGIHPQVFVDALKNTEVKTKREELSKSYEGQKVILGVDRADYIKGILQKFHGYELFLEKHPEWRGKVVLVQVAVPSRTLVPEYRRLKNETDKWVGQINGRFGSPGYVPLHYIANPVPFTDLCALYQHADVLLVTSVRDGMNLVSLEYAASQRDQHGVIVLSEFAGAAHSLSHAVFCNPWDVGSVADALQTALTMEEEERAKRAFHSFSYVRDFNALAWARRFLRDLQAGFGTTAHLAQELKSHYLALKKEYLKADKRYFFLDYDGTLVPFSSNPDEAAPTEELKALLSKLAENSKNFVQIISGRHPDLLGKWFEDVPVALCAEHGMFMRNSGEEEWQQAQPISEKWMEVVTPILHDFVKRTPGSFVEKKKASLAWHYRKAEAPFAEWQTRELMLHLEHTLANLPVQVLPGDKVVEVRPQGVHKGSAVRTVLQNRNGHRACILAFGDDRTDEDMFVALPPHAWSCRVGEPRTLARYYVAGPEDVHEILEELSSLS